MYETIFPAGWGLTRPDPKNPKIQEAFGCSLDELELRAKKLCIQLFGNLI